jgi:hypothetical protein
MLHDFEQTVFDHLRQPGVVYPLQAVIDRDGALAYVGGDIDAAVAAIEAELKSD